MKKLLFALAVFAFVLIISPVQAQESPELTLGVAPVAEAYGQDFNVFVLDFILTAPSSQTEVVNTITVKNYGTARDFYDFKKLTLWQDNGNNQFDGWLADQEIGTFYYSSVNSYYYLDNLSLQITDQGSRFYVSAEISSRSSLTHNRTIQLGIPVLVDNSSQGIFNLGDQGIFFDSGSVVPGTTLINENAISIRSKSTDVSSPLVKFSDPLDGQKITTNTYLIRGEAMDRGGSTPKIVQLEINGNVVDVESVGANYSTWQYHWTNITDGNYLIRTLAEDWVGNKNIYESEIEVIAGSQEPSLEQSSIYLSKETATANGSDEVYLTVVVKNSQGEALYDQLVIFSGPEWLQFSTMQGTTDGDGQVTVMVSASQVGVANIIAEVGSINLGPVDLEFVAEETPTEPETPIQPQTPTEPESSYELVKKPANPAVYKLQDNILKPFTSADIFFSYGYKFSEVVERTDLDNYAVGAAVLYRDGVLIKGNTSKVYVISEGFKRWIPSEEVFNGLGYKWENIKVIADGTIGLYPTGDALLETGIHPNGSLVKYENSSKIYLIENGQKRHIVSMDAFVNNGYKASEIMEISLSEHYPDGSVLE